nr:LemA family protein [Aliikangiella sp. G2MR2-5]
MIGLSELKGRVKPISESNHLTSPLTSSRCVWFHYIVEERRGSGKNAKWVTIEDREEAIPFKCKDAWGEVKVNPKDAELISKHHSSRRNGRLRYREKVIRLEDKIYLLGEARIDHEKGDQLEIRGNNKNTPFLITNLTERAIMMRKAHFGMGTLTIAFSSLLFSCLFYLGINGSFSPLDYFISAAIAPIYMSFIILTLHYNDLVFLKQRVTRNRSNIDVSLQKRAHLIPNLEKIIKKYLSHERALLEKIVKLRKDRKRPESILEIDQRVSQEQPVFANILALAENTPELKANKLNIKLMNQLVDLENEISLTRESFNDAVTYYNTRISSIPDVILARIFRFLPISLLRFEPQKLKRFELKFDKESDK